MVKGDFERKVEQYEEVEGKNEKLEEEIRGNNEQHSKLERLVGENSDKEDKFENEIRDLTERLKNAETNADFGERTVEKLESNIDGIQENLYQEKVEYKNMGTQL